MFGLETNLKNTRPRPQKIGLENKIGLETFITAGNISSWLQVEEA